MHEHHHSHHQQQQHPAFAALGLLGNSTQDQLQGICSNDNLYFILQAVAAVVCFGLVWYNAFMITHVPNPKSGENYGRPYIIGVLLFNICLWNLAPMCIMFVVFHIAIPNSFEMVTNMACLQVTGIPFFTIFLFFNALLILTMYRPIAHRDNISALVNNDKGVAGGGGSTNVPTKVLHCGLSTRGMWFIDAHRKKQQGATKSDTFGMMYYDNKPSVVANAVAAGVIGSEAEADKLNILAPTRVGDLLVGIPLSDSSMDKIVLCPFLRQMQPVGDFVTPEKDKAPRMKKLLVEAIRVLKTGGDLVVVDSAMNCLLLEADLRDLGCKGVHFDDVGVESGAIAFMKSKYYETRWTKTADVEERVMAEVNSAPSFLTMSFTEDKAELEEGASPLNIAEREPLLHAHKPPKKTGRLLAVSIYQACVFAALLFVAAATFKPLNYPTNIVIGARVNGIVASTSLNYPMMAYFTRQLIVNAHHDSAAFAVAFGKMVGTDLLAMLATLLYSALLWVPQFGLQLGLNNTGLSDDAKSMIGIAISITIGIVGYKVTTYKSKKSTFESRNISMEHWKK